MTQLENLQEYKITQIKAITDFNSKGTISISTKLQNDWPSSDLDRKNRNNQIIKYLTLRGMAQSFEDSTLISILKDTLLTTLTETQENLTKLVENRSKLLENKEQYKRDLESQFLNIVASVFDPHTSYFTNEKKEAFEKDLSKEALTWI